MTLNAHLGSVDPPISSLRVLGAQEAFVLLPSEPRYSEWILSPVKEKQLTPSSTPGTVKINTCSVSCNWVDK